MRRASRVLRLRFLVGVAAVEPPSVGEGGTATGFDRVYNRNTRTEIGGGDVESKSV